MNVFVTTSANASALLFWNSFHFLALSLDSLDQNTIIEKENWPDALGLRHIGGFWVQNPSIVHKEKAVLKEMSFVVAPS